MEEKLLRNIAISGSRVSKSFYEEMLHNRRKKNIEEQMKKSRRYLDIVTDEINFDFIKTE